jgi:hypothetical protein
MNERKQPVSPSEHDDVDPPPVTTDPVRDGTTVVFSGDPAQVSAGFALALQLMGMDASEQMPRAGDRNGQEE